MNTAADINSTRRVESVRARCNPRLLSSCASVLKSFPRVLKSPRDLHAPRIGGTGSRYLLSSLGVSHWQIALGTETKPTLNYVATSLNSLALDPQATGSNGNGCADPI